MAKNSGGCKAYAGKIGHQSTQTVKAPFGGTSAVKGNQRITGNDLRSGGKSGKTGK